MKPSLQSLIIRAYTWWEMQRARHIALAPANLPLRERVNRFAHSPHLLDHTHKGVTTPNNDTYFSFAWLDLAKSPIRIDVPKNSLPYWSIAILDMDTDIIAMMGHNHDYANELILAHIDYQGELPQNVPVVRVKSRITWALGRFLIGSEEITLQADTARRGIMLSRVNSNEPLTEFAPKGLIAAERKNAQNFWEIIKFTLEEDVHLEAELAQFYDKPLNTLFATKDWQSLSPAMQTKFTEEYANVLDMLDKRDPQNTYETTCWKFHKAGIGKFGDNHFYRAEIALWALAAFELREVVYASCFHDADKNALRGENTYKITVPKGGLPARAFWSLTLYEIDSLGGLYFTNNPIKRYSISNRTQGVVLNDDGTLTFTVSHAVPIDTSNWLPAPEGKFALFMRAYHPDEGLMNGKIDFPNVVKF